MQEEFATVRATPDQVIELVLRDAGIRPGLSELVRWSRAEGHRFIVFSSGFRTVIQATLDHWGLGDLEVVSHEALLHRRGVHPGVVRPRRDLRRVRPPLQAPRPARPPARRAAGLHRRRRSATAAAPAWPTWSSPAPTWPATSPRPACRLRPLRGLRRGARVAPGLPDAGRMSTDAASGSWREVTPAAEWGAMEERVLAFWRERGVFARSLSERAGAEPFVFYEGPADGQRRAPAPTTCCSRVFKDIFPRFQTMRGRFVDRARPAGTATGCRSRSRSRSGSASRASTEIEALRHRGVQRALPRVGGHLRSTSGSALTERIGFWIDLDDAYRTMHNDYIESVWWALARAVRAAGCSTAAAQGRALLPALRHRAVEPRGRPGLPGRRRPVGLRTLPPEGRRRVAPGLDHDAVDAAVQSGRRDPPRCDLCRRRARRTRR